MEDLTFDMIFDYSRHIGLFGSGFGAGGPSIYVPTAIVPSGVPQYSNQWTGLVSVETKITDRSFVPTHCGATPKWRVSSSKFRAIMKIMKIRS
jgi:hypothetical protein